MMVSFVVVLLLTRVPLWSCNEVTIATNSCRLIYGVLWACDCAPLKTSCFLWYADDTFVIWRHGIDKWHEESQFLVFLNNLHSNIKFTTEVENGVGLPFLDVFGHRKGDGFLGGQEYKNQHILTCISPPKATITPLRKDQCRLHWDTEPGSLLIMVLCLKNWENV